MSSSTGNACRSVAPEKVAVVSRYLVAATASFAFFAIVVHALVLHQSGSANSMGSIGVTNVDERTWVFGATGVSFLVLTWLSHLVIASTLTSGSGASRSEQGPLLALLISMAIRVAGTFAILGLLWNLEIVGRKEAVFDVLFWYVTLTAMEVIGIVCTSKCIMRNSPLGQVVQASDS